MGIFDWLFGKKKAEPAAAPQVKEKKPAEPAAAPQVKEKKPAEPAVTPQVNEEKPVSGSGSSAEVDILRIGTNMIDTIRAIRAYTSPYYSLDQARNVIAAVPCTLQVTDEAAFCAAMRKAGCVVRGRSEKDSELAAAGVVRAVPPAGRIRRNENAGPACSDPERFRRIMTSQVLAMYLYDHDEACREEYLRRLKICGLSEERAEQYMAFETEILNRCPRPEMVDKNFIARPCFNLSTRALPHEPAYYAEHFDYPLSYIIKLSDEAEWHFWNSHEADLPDEVWSEIFDLSDKNRKLFLPYAQNMVDALGWSYQEVNKFSFNEQGMLDLYRWNRGMTRAAKQPWGIA